MWDCEKLVRTAQLPVVHSVRHGTVYVKETHFCLYKSRLGHGPPRPRETGMLGDPRIARTERRIRTVNDMLASETAAFNVTNNDH